MALEPPILLIEDSRKQILSWVVRNDAWHYGGKNKHGNFRHKNKYVENILSILWDPLISVEDEIILNEFHSMKDGMQNGFVVVHLGVWAQKIIKQTMKESPNKRTESIKQLLNRLDHRLMTLKNVSKEAHATLIFLLDPHTDMHPIWFPDFDPPNINLSMDSLSCIKTP